MTDFNDVPAFLLDRAINALERLRGDLEHEIAELKRQQFGRDWKARQRRQIQSIKRDLLMKGFTDEDQARIWLTEQGHDWKYAGAILETWRDSIERQKKAARDVEIFRRWIIGKEKKAALAREFGVSRATVERICRKHADNDGLRKVFAMAKKTSVPTHALL